jgi:hypothetical protein
MANALTHIGDLGSKELFSFVKQQTFHLLVFPAIEARVIIS